MSHCPSLSFNYPASGGQPISRTLSRCCANFWNRHRLENRFPFGIFPSSPPNCSCSCSSSLCSIRHWNSRLQTVSPNNPHTHTQKHLHTECMNLCTRAKLSFSFLILPSTYALHSFVISARSQLPATLNPHKQPAKRTSSLDESHPDSHSCLNSTLTRPSILCQSSIICCSMTE